MCRTTLSVGWDGTLYDCDFNQMLELPVDHGAPHTLATLSPGRRASRARSSPTATASAARPGPGRPARERWRSRIPAMAARQVQDHHLKVAPQMLGQPLGSPGRRVLAILFDGLLLIVPTIAVALGAAALSLRASDRAAWDGLRVLLPGHSASASATHDALRALTPLLVRLEAPGLPPAAALAVEEGRLDEAADLLATRELEFSLRLDESGETPLAPGRVRVPIEKLIPAGVRAMALLGVPALYFTLLHRALRCDPREAPGGPARAPPRRRAAVARRVLRAVHGLPAHPGPAGLAGPRPLA